MMSKGPIFVIVTGGVISSVGKGVASGVISALLQQHGYKTQIKKFDPYLNVDPGTLSPTQHGEVYVTQDGAEVDLDGGHYERLGNVVMSKSDYTAMGQVMHWIISEERRGNFAGQTVQVIPHVTDRIKQRFLENTDNSDVVICEIGGTVGDIESRPFLEAARQFHQEYKRVLFVHIGCIVQPSWVDEPKTKPLQHSVSTLQEYGIRTDILGCRVDRSTIMTEGLRRKISVMCNIEASNVVPMSNADGGLLYSLVEQYAKDGLDTALLSHLSAFQPAPRASQSISFQNFRHLRPYPASIAIVTKYCTSEAHQSLQEALLHASISRGYSARPRILSAESLNEDDLRSCNGIVVAGGFGARGVTGKLRAVAYARTHSIPYLGICFGMQLAVIESLRASGVEADSVELKPDTPHPAVCLIERWSDGDTVRIGVDSASGGTLRLGGHACTIVPDSIAYSAYNGQGQELVINPRHRHRYEINHVDFEERIKQSGMCITGRSVDGLIEIVERTEHPWFVGVQYHPEFSSRLNAPEGLIQSFVDAVLAIKSQDR
jgi:CTP synthase